MLEKDAMFRGLERVERLASGHLLGRLAHSPLRYLFAQLWQKVLYPVFRKGYPITTSTFFGHKLHIELPAATDIFLTAGKGHPSEIRLARFMIQQLQHGDLFVDIGAHVGYFSALGHYLVGDQGQVMAIEAAPTTFSLLQKNLSGLEGCEVHHVALASTKGTLHFYVFPVRYSEYNTLDTLAYQDEPWFEKNPPTVVEVPSITLDDLLRDKQPALIKVDVEGAEDLVVRGGKEFLRTFEGPLVLEYIRNLHSAGGHQRAHMLLLENRFRAFVINNLGNLDPCADPEMYLREVDLESDNLVYVHSRM